MKTRDQFIFPFIYEMFPRLSGGEHVCADENVYSFLNNNYQQSYSDNSNYRECYGTILELAPIYYSSGAK